MAPKNFLWLLRFGNFSVSVKASICFQKNDQLASTKKDLQEKEQQLDFEHSQKQAVVLKLKDVREEYNQFKAKSTAVEKSFQEKITKHQQEVTNLSSRIKQLQEQLAAEKEKTNQVFFL